MTLKYTLLSAKKISWKRVPSKTYQKHPVSHPVLEILLMLIHASVASTEYKIVILTKMISNNDLAEFHIIIFSVTCQPSYIFTIFWPNDLMALLWKIETFIVKHADDRVTFDYVRCQTDSSVKW